MDKSESSTCVFLVAARLAVKQAALIRICTFSGFSKGVSQRPLSENSIDKSIHSGLQIDIGYQHSLHESLLLSIHATNEKREIDQNGNLSGGFSIDGTAKDQLNRIAMKLTYQIL